MSFALEQKLISIAVALTAMLVFIWHVPEVIAVRYAVLSAALISFGVVIYRLKDGFLTERLRQIKPLLLFVFVFTVWAYLHAVFIAVEPLWSIKELNSQLLVSLFAFILGILVASVVAKDSFGFGTRVLPLLFMAYMVHVLYVDLFAMRHFVEFKEIPLRIAGLTKGHDEVSYLMSTFSAFVATEFFFRFILKKKMLPVSDSLFLLIVFAFAVALVIQAKRNGMISAAFLVFSLLFLWLYERRLSVSKSKIVISVLAALFAVVLIAFASYKTDPRWGSFAQTVEVALDTKAHKAWLNWDKYGAPSLPDGAAVNHSNYMRLAWIKEGALLMVENPMGYGYGRNVCGHAFFLKYGEGKGHSHSGIVDLGVGLGVVGVVLWYGMLAFAAVFGVRTYMRRRSYAGMLLFFIVVGFGSRMLIDSINRDHMLEQFMFLMALLFTLAAADRATKQT